MSLNIDLAECRYNFALQVFIKVALPEGGEGDVMVGDLRSGWRPVPEDLTLSGSASFPAHSALYGLQHDGNWFGQTDFMMLQILGEDNLGAAKVTWSFKPTAGSTP